VKEFSIIWKQFSKNSDLGRHLKTEDDFGLPYFVDGKNKQEFENSKLKRLSEFNLLRGILVGYFDNPPIIDTNIFKQKAEIILEDLKDHFNFESTEKLILDIATFLRNENGDQVSFIALLAGTEILPNSSVIKFDCCTDLYNQIERDDYSNKELGKKKLHELLNQIDKKKIDPAFIQHFETYKNL